MGFPFPLVMATDEEVAKEPNAEELSLATPPHDLIMSSWTQFVSFIRGSYGGLEGLTNSSVIKPFLSFWFFESTIG